MPLHLTTNDGAVIGPASSTDNAVARFDGTTGKLVQNSSATVDDVGVIESSATQTGKLEAPTVIPSAGVIASFNAVFTGTPGGATHRYVIIGYNSNGHSQTTSTWSGGVTGPSTTLDGSNYVTVSWTTSTQPSSIKIFRRLADTGTYKHIATVPGTTTSYVDNDSSTFLADTGTSNDWVLRRRGSLGSVMLNSSATSPFITANSSYFEINDGRNTAYVGVAENDISIDAGYLNFTGSSNFTGNVYINGHSAATISTTETLTNKTLTSPKIDTILNSAGTTGLAITNEANPVNYVEIESGATLNAPDILAKGTDTNIDLRLWAKGTGKVRIGSGVAVSETATQTLTNKRITPRVNTSTSSSSYSIVSDTNDQYSITALATATTINAPTGTPTDGQKLLFRIKDDGTARAITWNAIYRAIGVLLPTTTTISKTLYVGCIYNSADTKWDVIAVSQEA